MSMELTHGSLFAGIGGFDLGFERAGIKTIWQVEINEYCRRVLAKHWPSVQRFSDIRRVGKDVLEKPDILSGGFPCQDISSAGERAGIEGERSGLWREYARIIGELRPKYVVVENVAALLVRGIERVLGDLAEIGYDAEWQIISAEDVGAPHERERVWLVAYPARRDVAWRGYSRANQSDSGCSPQIPEGVCNADSERLETSSFEPILCEQAFGFWNLRHFGTAGSARVWEQPMPPKSTFCGMADGIPNRVDRLKGLGNAIVPQIAEWIGRRIVQRSKGESLPISY